MIRPKMSLLMSADHTDIASADYSQTIRGAKPAVNKNSTIADACRKCALVLVSVTMISGCGVMGLDNVGELLPADDGFNKRLYAGGGLLVSQLEPDTSNGISVKESASRGVGVFLGYDLTNRLGIEAHWADLGFSELAPDGSVSYRVAGISAVFHGFNTEANRYRREGFSVFGRVGLGGVDNGANQVNYERVDESNLLAGAGVEYGLSNGLAARVELMAHESDTRYLQGSVLYRFGRAAAAVNASPAPNLEQPRPPVQSEQLPQVPEFSAIPNVDSLDPAPMELPSFEAPEPEVTPADSDADGVINSVDDCPDTVSGVPVNATGCAIFGGAIEGVAFFTGSDQLTESAATVLDEVAAVLKQYPDIRITIEAHTDNVGETRDNLQLSRRRALAVARYLIDQDISGSRLAPRAFGEAQPRESNSTREGRAANRRVEFRVIE